MTHAIAIDNGKHRAVIGPGQPTYIIAELSANHNQDLDEALRLVRAAKEAGADAIKLQTYTPDTITLDCRSDVFRVKKGAIWADQYLYDLYRDAYTPWDWHARLKAEAEGLGLHLFSTPFDPTAVDYLTGLDMPAYKIASFELVDLPLIRLVASKGKPIIMSTGMATLAEIDEAVQAAREGGCRDLVLLKTNSAYPAPPEHMNLRSIPHLTEAFGVPAGLSDHTMGIAVPVAAVALGACVIEKHFTLSRAVPGPDSQFSLEPAEFRAMVDAVRTAEKALGEVHYGPCDLEVPSVACRRSLFVVEDVKEGQAFDGSNVRSIRPSAGMHTRHLDEVLGRKASQDIQRGTPLSWSLIN